MTDQQPEAGQQPEQPEAEQQQPEQPAAEQRPIPSKSWGAWRHRGTRHLVTSDRGEQ